MENAVGKTVVVGLSGGVDSSVSALLLKEQGYNVIGIFMRNWNDPTVLIDDECPWVEDSNDAMMVADKLEIPFQTLDLSEQYKQRIVDYMFSEYEAGRTPNPDVLCNREIKFDVFLKAALKLGADYVATGHYCQKNEQIIDGKAIFSLIAGADKNKDQSYFLCQITQEQLSRILFPIGHLQKHEVRELAHRAGLITAGKKDSQGLCFIGKISLPDFLQRRLATKKGVVVEIEKDSPVFKRRKDAKPTDETSEEYLKWLCERWHFVKEDGSVIGEHNGAHFYTVGQRRGLNIGGKPLPIFVLAIDVSNNIIYVGQGEKHRGLSGTGLFMNHSDISFVREDLAPALNTSLRVKTRIRYRQPLFEAELFHRHDGYYLVFDNMQYAVAPGQFAAFYINAELIGSGAIAP
ncbi:MAG: tRNA 2-thiouridine(34) synthase MnmA [Bacteroidetes bacterium]|nr:tRNA 2-thiouridine(34) synthase MnmA [Bacteroidota bacterium]